MTGNDEFNKDQCVMHSEKIHQLELGMVEIRGDVKHIRERIDNGLGTTISKVWDKLNTMALERAREDAEIKTQVLANSGFIEKLKNALIWISVTSVAGGVITLVLRFLFEFTKSSA
jgi:hypothetical protein